MNSNDLDQIPAQNAARPAGHGNRAALYTSIAAAAIGAAGLAAALVVGLAPANAGTHVEHHATHSQISPVVIPVPVPTDNGGNGPTTGGGSSTPSVQPSAAIRSLQQQLGQLNYYEGPVNGISSAQLHQAIEYLQRDAHLPQTGVLTPATQNALDRMLANGNSQMGGN
jgi:peptidoglycan hydrolase-like protein with peptidoglycan-binding domain